MKKQEQLVLAQVEKEVRRRMEGEEAGHDFWHVERVRRMAMRIGKHEGANMFIVELAALLHDIADWKFYGGDDTVGPKVAREILRKLRVQKNTVEHVCEIIATMSFKGAGVKASMRTLEGKVVQDADRLDALGAIGIARAFAYGGYRSRPLYDLYIKPAQHKTKETYIKSQGTTINHFYEKLLLLKDRMNTKTAKKIAASRHRFLKLYLARFFKEWEGQT